VEALRTSRQRNLESLSFFLQLLAGWSRQEVPWGALGVVLTPGFTPSPTTTKLRRHTDTPFTPSPTLWHFEASKRCFSDSTITAISFYAVYRRACLSEPTKHIQSRGCYLSKAMGEILERFASIIHWPVLSPDLDFVCSCITEETYSYYGYCPASQYVRISS
jgi:hypothetical protein